MTIRTTDSIAVVETRVVHDAQRRASTLLSDAARPPSAPTESFMVLRDFVIASLRHHHHQEDHDLWAILLTATRTLDDELAALSSEHDRLDEALDALAATPSFEAASRVRDFVHEHLAHEEPVLFPALRTYVDPDAWEAFSQRAVASTPPEIGYLLVGLFHDVAPAEDVDLVLRHLPPDVRAEVPAMRAEARSLLDALRAVHR